MIRPPPRYTRTDTLCPYATRFRSEGSAGTADMDRIMRDGVGFRMGPFELMDLTALDVTHPASVLIYEQFYHEPRYRPSLLLGSRYEAAILGRKVGNGFYDYKDGHRVDPEEPTAPDYDCRKVWVSTAEADGEREHAGSGKRWSGHVHLG